MSAPVPTPPAGWYADPKAPPGTDANTPWIWLIVLMPIVPTVLLLFVPWDAAFDIDPTAPDPRSGMAGTLALYLSPFLWISTALNYLVYGLSVFFAYRDVRDLSARGVPRPFHWAFAFLGGIVYAIGRSVIVGRRTGSGYAPIWVEVGVVVLSLAVSAVILIAMFSGMADLVASLREYH
jgi:hypothetical protein